MWAVNPFRNFFRSRCAACLLISALGSWPVAARQALVTEVLSLPEAIALAQQHDPWLQGNHHRQRAVEADSVAAGQLPDPQLSLGVANLPVDSLQFNQEPMTQLTVAVSQVFPRGQSRQLQQQHLSQIGASYPYQRADRRAKVAVTLSQAWLDYYRYRQSIALIEKDRALFEHLVEVAQSHYASAMGQTRQQDLIRAQLELTQLEDRLTQLHQHRDTAQAALAEWLDAGPLQGTKWTLSETLPDIPLLYDLPRTGAESGLPSLSSAALNSYLLNHPAVLDAEQRIQASQTSVALARQSYRPQWGLRAGYGYRDEDPMGNDRDDFFSLGITVDVPLFTARRQDKTVQSAVSRVAAAATEKILLLRQLRAGFDAAWRQLQRLEQRQNLYSERLMAQVHQQAEASLSAYTNDTGDFAEVVRARIAELNAGIDLLNISIDRSKTIVQINYFLTAAADGDASMVLPEQESHHE